MENRWPETVRDRNLVGGPAVSPSPNPHQLSALDGRPTGIRESQALAQGYSRCLTRRAHFRIRSKRSSSEPFGFSGGIANRLALNASPRPPQQPFVYCHLQVFSEPHPVAS